MEVNSVFFSVARIMQTPVYSSRIKIDGPSSLRRGGGDSSGF